MKRTIPAAPVRCIGGLCGSLVPAPDEPAYSPNHVAADAARKPLQERTKRSNVNADGNARLRKAVGDRSQKGQDLLLSEPRDQRGKEERIDQDTQAGARTGTQKRQAPRSDRG